MKTFNLYITESTKFQIHPDLKDKYKIKGDLGNVEKWKAKTILANSGGKKGTWDNVGYVMISPKDNTIIPIARSDEHQSGYDLLYHLRNKYDIHALDYKPVYAIGNNYVDMNNQKEIDKYLKIFKKFRNMGGNNLQVDSWDNISYHGTIDDFLKRKGTIGYKKGELSETGKNLISDLERLAKMLKKILTDPVASDKLIWMFNDTTIDFLKRGFIKYPYPYDGLTEYIGYSEIDKWYESLQKATDYKLAEKVLFSMNGVKNKIHNAIRIEMKKSSSERSKKKLESILGHLETAFKEFNRLGQI
jgi:hypothetical protein